MAVVVQNTKSNKTKMIIFRRSRVICLTRHSSWTRNFLPNEINRYLKLNLISFYSNDSRMTTKDRVMNEFFHSFVNQIEVQYQSKSKSNVGNYQDKVFELLHSNKDKLNKFQDIDYYNLQYQIETLTTQFDDLKNIYQLAPDIINKMISKDNESALDFLRKKKLSDHDMELLKYMEHHTLEAVMVYVLGSLFNSIQDSPAVRVSTLVDYLHNYVKTHGYILKSRKNGSQKTMNDSLPNPTDSTNKDDSAKIRKEYLIGTFLVEFLVSRELITLTNDLDMSSTTIYPNKNKGKYYYPKSLYAICNFNIQLLPVKLNLPMVCEPVDWCKVDDVNEAKSITDLYGGYLYRPFGDFYLQRYRLLTSRDYEHFNITLGSDYQKVCNAMNYLQKQEFTINTDMLNFINKYYDILVKLGLLMPKILASLNITKTIEQLRVFYLKDESLMKVFSFKELLKLFMTRVQSARFEVFILNLASAYSGYKIYLPAFLDFRGRIYRSGILHFHERDLARCLLVYANPKLKMSEVDDLNLKVSYYHFLFSAIAFHYKKFISYKEAIEWFYNNIDNNYKPEKLILFSVDASNPFQFISKVISLYDDHEIDPLQLPITQDASASAYQIMAFFLLDQEIAMKTNLIPSVDDSISDIYLFFLEELKVDLQIKYDDSLSDIICSRLTRKLIKQLFMPLIYGKTVMSMANDINQHYSTLLNHKECMILASHISKFFIQRFPGISNLMALVRSVSWLTSVMDKPIIYDTPLLTTIQDYMKSDIAPLWVYDRIQKKRRQVTLRIPTLNRDRRKTNLATFANFIHQKDANIAMFMIIQIMLDYYDNVPIYTVHDNFITTIPYAKVISDSYINVICDGRNPLFTINNFIIQNLVPVDDYTIQLGLYDLNEPLPTSYISYILRVCVPSSLNEKQKEKIKKSLIDTYENYVNTVSKDNGKNVNYDYKLHIFKKQMYKWMKLDYNYSLHL